MNYAGRELGLRVDGEVVVGSGLGAMASQLGSVTVSAVPDEQSGEVGGVQNTGRVGCRSGVSRPATSFSPTA